jgi:hypothetical protein
MDINEIHEPAHPNTGYGFPNAVDFERYYSKPGLSIYQEFVRSAMQGLLSNPDIIAARDYSHRQDRQHDEGIDIARMAIIVAEETLKRL